MTRWAGKPSGTQEFFTPVTAGAVIGVIAEKIFLAPNLPKELVSLEPYLVFGSMFVFALCFLIGAYYLNKDNGSQK